MKTSYAEARVGTECLICGTTNHLVESLQCKKCSAPMSLAQDSAAQAGDHQIISILGASNVGKTVYLGFLLDMLSQRAGAFEAIPVGAYSIDVQQAVISHMANRTFPPKTPMEADQWYWAYYQIGRQEGGTTQWVDLIMPDMAGESLAAEVAAPDTFRVIRSLVTKSAGILLLVDAALAANGSSQPDFFGLKMLSYIDSMNGTPRDQLIRTPLGIVLCKADYCPECFDDPRRFAEANFNRLWNMCRNRCANIEFFACSVVGSLAYATAPQDDYVVPLPLHTALRGVLEPFQWIANQL